MTLAQVSGLTLDITQTDEYALVLITFSFYLHRKSVLIIIRPELLEPRRRPSLVTATGGNEVEWRGRERWQRIGAMWRSSSRKGGR